MLDPLDEQFSDMSLIDDFPPQQAEMSQPTPPQASAPVQTPMYDQRFAAQEEPRLTVAQALAKAGSVVPGVRTEAIAPRMPGVTPAPTGTYTPFLLAAVGAVAGGMYAGWWGAAAGAFGVGAIVNANRWHRGYPSKKTDGLFALATAGGAVYSGYKAYQHRQKATPKPSNEPDVLELDEDDDQDEVASNSAKPSRRAWLKPIKR